MPQLTTQLHIKPSSQYDARPCDALQRRVIVAQNRLFPILSDVVQLVAVGGDAMQSYIAMLAKFGMTSHRVAGPCDDLHHIVN